MRAEWERNAAWWQGAFTEGADPEYEEQILPLVAERLGGCRRVLVVGTGEGGGEKKGEKKEKRKKK
jgi:hypothetical protein